MRAKRTLKYEWGGYPNVTKRIVGRVIESQRGTEGNGFQRTINRIEVPIPDAKLLLYDAITGETINRFSDRDGQFSFDSVNRGTYVLHIEGGRSSGYDATDLLLKLDPSTTKGMLLLSLRQDMSTCGPARFLDLKVVD